MTLSQVTHALCVSTTLENFNEVLSLATSHPRLFASVGVHPSEKDCEEPSVEDLVRLSAHSKVVAIGETGLDYYWDKGDTGWQRDRFRVHIRAAAQVEKPLIVHTRDAAGDTISIMRDEGARRAGGVMHCFTETVEVARQALDLGFFISLSGIVTFKSAAQVREVAAMVPLDRLLIETDSPYLAPVPHRGKTNEPSFVVHVANEIARIKSIPIEEVARVTTANFQKLFKLSLQ